MLTAKHSSFIKQQAYLLGFDYCGIAKAQMLDDDAKRLENWLNTNMHGQMKYMENYFDMRVDPRKLVPGAKSVITLLKNYFPSQQQQPGTPKISKYAYGKDYHEVIRSKNKTLLQLMQDEIGEINGRGFVDSAPVLERSWAQRSGLGWVGKNGNLLTKESGSFFFIATLITDLELEYDDPFEKDFCGTCTRCIDACPTDALELTQDFELASYTREGAIWDRQTLEQGPQPTRYERSDVTSVPAASTVAEATVALAVANAFLEKYGGDSLHEILRRYEGERTA